MKKSDIIRAWKDPEFRATLKDAPTSPAGIVELEDVALEAISGSRVTTTNPVDQLSPNPIDTEVGISLTDTTSVCTVSGWRISCGYICTLTTECGC